MHACNGAARRNARAKKLLLAAIGIAGCTGGPKLASTTTESPSALVQPSDAQQSEAQSSRSFLASVMSSGPQSIWGRNTASSPATPRDPFLAHRPDGFRTASTPQVGISRATASHVPRQRTTLVQPVAFEDTNAYCGTPNGVTIRPRQETPGVVHIKDHRLPPAKPLGASNPFDPNVVAGKPRIQATQTTNRIAAKPAPNTNVQIQPVNRDAASTVPVQKYLATRVTTSGTTGSSIRHEDMIVDTAILPKRRDWRAATLPPASQGSEQFVISARQPFETPEWDDATPKSTSSANLPVEISPAAAFDRPSAAMQLAKRGEIPAASDITPPATVPDPFELAADPFAAEEFADAPEFGDEPKFGDTASDEPLTVAAAPLLAPGSVVSTSPEPTGNSKMVAGPAIAPAPPEDVEPPAPVAAASSAVMAVEPVQLDQANESAAREAAQQQNALGTPAVIGIALAIVAFGAVIIRRRFA